MHQTLHPVVLHFIKNKITPDEYSPYALPPHKPPDLRSEMLTATIYDLQCSLCGEQDRTATMYVVPCLFSLAEAQPDPRGQTSGLRLKSHSPVPCSLLTTGAGLIKLPNTDKLELHFRALPCGTSNWVINNDQAE